MNGCVITRVAPGAPGCVDEGFFHSEILNILHIVAFQMISTPLITFCNVVFIPSCGKQLIILININILGNTVMSVESVRASTDGAAAVSQGQLTGRVAVVGIESSAHAFHGPFLVRLLITEFAVLLQRVTMTSELCECVTQRCSSCPNVPTSVKPRTLCNTFAFSL